MCTLCEQDTNISLVFLPGFIMMTPQLFINYKLKSVAHLPWRMLSYKALNTFIDDLFAFVIKMPTLYRIGCFRDGTWLITNAYCKACFYVIYTIILLKSVCLSSFANCRSQFLLDLLGRCLKLFVSAESISCHKFAFQFGLAFFLYAKNIKNIGVIGSPVRVVI